MSAKAPVLRRKVRHTCDVELLSKITQSAKMESQILLPFRELATTHIVGTEEVEDAVNNQEAVVACGELLSKFSQSVVLVFTVCGANDKKIIVCLLRID